MAKLPAQPQPKALSEFTVAFPLSPIVTVAILRLLAKRQNKCDKCLLSIFFHLKYSI